MNTRLMITLLFVLALSSGCATSSPIACSANNLADNNAAMCRTIDEQAQQDFVASTGQSGCTFELGLFAGEHGQFPSEFCHPKIADEYHDGYVMGRKIFEASDRLEIVSKALETSRNRLWQLEANADGIGRQAEIARTKSTINALIQVRDFESRRLIGLRGDNTQ